MSTPSDPTVAAPDRPSLRAAFERGEISAAEAARAAEVLGDVTLALTAWQVVVRGAPDHPEGWQALAALHEARGDAQRAATCRARAEGRKGGVPAATSDDAPVPAPEAPPEAPDGPTDADLVRFCALFAGREGVHARMWRNPEGIGYSPVDQSLSPEVVQLHLSGAQTVGIYLVRLDQTVTCACFDLDVGRRALQDAAGDVDRTRRLRQELAEAGVRLARDLRALGLDPLLVDSGWKGRHAWCFLPRPQDAGEVLAWGTAMVAALRPSSPSLTLEFFPKQGRVATDGLGNLVKLPLGLHLASGRRAVILDADGVPVGGPWARLRSVRRMPLPEPPPPRPAPPAPPDPELAPFTPAPAPGDFTEAEFETSEEVGPVYRGCAVIRAIVEQALRERRVSRDEAVVLEHSIGHGPDGVRAVNYVLDRVPDYPSNLRMQSPHRGSPISCQRVRQRAPGHARRVGCDCPLDPKPGEYANPLLHRGDLRPRPPDASLDDVLEQLARAEDRLRTVQAEVARLRATGVRRLADVPGRRWPVQGGEWALVDEDGVTVLRWHGA